MNRKNCIGNQLLEVPVDESNAYYKSVDGVLFSYDKTRLIKYPADRDGKKYSVPDTVTHVSEYAFEDSINIRTVVFDSDIVSMGMNAFASCSKLAVIYFKESAPPMAVGANAFATYDKTNTELSDPRTTIYYSAGYSEEWQTFISAHSGYRFAEYHVSAPQSASSNAEYYAVVVIDKAGFPINNINIELTDPNGYEFGAVTAEDGIVTFLDQYDEHGVGFDIDFKGQYVLRVVDNLGEYYSFENSEFYLDEDARITYITLSGVPAVSGVSASYDVKASDKITGIISHDIADMIIVGDGYQTVDINSEVAKINVWCVDEVAITVNCNMDTGTEIVGFSLVQNGKVILTENDPVALEQMLTDVFVGEDSGKKVVSLVFSVETSRLEIEQDLYAVVELSDGTQVQTKLNVHIIRLDFYSVDLSWIKEGMTFQVSEELVNILKGFDRELEIVPQMKNKKTIFSIKVEPDSFKIAYGIGNNWDKGWDENGIENYEKYEDYWKAFDTYTDAVKKGTIPKNVPFEYTSKGETKLNVVGFLELKYKGLDGNGDKDFSVETGATGTISFTYSFGSTYVVAIPIRVDGELSAEGKVTLKLVFDKDAEKFISLGTDFEIKGELMLSAGIGCKVVSAGVYGKAETVLVIPNFNVEKWSLSGDVGVYVKYDGLFVKWKKTWSVFKGLGIDTEWVIYEDGKWWYETDGTVASISEVSFADAVYDESAYEIALSSSETTESAFSFDSAQSDQTNAYAGIDPKMIQVGDLVYIVYHENLDGYSSDYDDYNYQKIVYRTYNVQTGEFSDVNILDDNGYADGAYEVYYDGNDAVILYTQLNKKLTTDNIDDMSGYVGSLEVKTAVLNNGGFTAFSDALTNDEYYDMHLRLGVIEGKITAVWVRNEENTMFGTTDNNNLSVWYSVYENGAWSESVCVKSGINTVTDIEIGTEGIAYITDTNNDLTTVGADKETQGYSDRVISVIDMSGDLVLNTTEEAGYHDVSYLADEIIYYQENNLYSVDTSVSLFDTPIAELTEDYTILTDANGNVKAILFVSNVIYDEASGADGSNVFAIFRDGEYWGEPIQITDFGKEVFVSAFDAIDFGEELLLSVLLSEVNYSSEAVDEYETYSTVNRFETLWISYPTEYQMGDVTADFETVAPNSETTLTVQVFNNGYQTATNIFATVMRNGESLYSGEVSEFYDADGNKLTHGLLPGTYGYVYVRFDVGEVDDSLPYTVTVGEKSEDIQLWYSDFTVFGKQVLIGDTHHIIARVINNGYLSASYQLTASVNGTEIWSQDTEILGFNETQYFTVPLNCSLAGDGSDIVTVSLDADSEHVLGNNEAKINVTAEEALTISTESLSVWISETSATVDRSNAQDVCITFDDSYSIEAIEIAGSDAAGLYEEVGNSVVFDANTICAKYSNGVYSVRMKFSDGSVDEDGNPVYKYASFSLTVTQTFTVKWVADGIELDVETYEIGGTPQHVSPAKNSDAQYTYSFVGWDHDSDGVADALDTITVTSDMVFEAIFDCETNSYKISWKLNDLQTETETYLYGEMPAYEGIPVKTSNVQYDYVFVGWDKEISAVTEDAIYTAVYDKILRQYSVTTVVDGESTVISVDYGTVPSLKDPSKPSDAQYDYVFVGWSPKVSAVYGDQTYTAVFECILRQYTVIWNVDGEVIQQTYDYGSVPVFNGTPVKEGNAQYMYVFVGWDSSVTAVKEDVMYTAIFEGTVNRYKITFSVDGETFEESYAYGSIPSYEGDLSKASDEKYRYVFVGWDKEICAVEGDAIYTAQYDAILLGSAFVTNTSFKAARNSEFVTVISLAEVQNMTETGITLQYDPTLVALNGYEVFDGVTVTEIGIGYISLYVTGLSEDLKTDVLKINFVTCEDAPIGNTEFMDVYSEDIITSRLGALTVYQTGDVNSDGSINSKDVLLLKMHLSGLLVNIHEYVSDVDGDGVITTEDAAMLAQIAG